jgi:hypothetical protein
MEARMRQKTIRQLTRFALVLVAFSANTLAAGCAAAAWLPGGRQATAPASACSGPTLTIAGRELPVIDLAPDRDGNFNLRAGAAPAAYRLAGKGEGYAYLLNPAADYFPLLNSVKPGSQALVTLPNCDKASFELVPPVTGRPNLKALSFLPRGRVSISVLPAPGADGLTVSGAVSGEEINPDSQPSAAPGSGPEAEVTLLSVSEARPGAPLEIILSITAAGSNAFDLNPADISLSTPSGQTLAPTGVEPSLPARVSPGKPLQVRLAFDAPAGDAGVLKVLGMELDLGG